MDFDELHGNRLTRTPCRHASGHLWWVRPKHSGSQRELGSRSLVTPFKNMRIAQFPHQEAEGTSKTRSSAVQVRLCGKQCTEHWLLFARTPETGEGGKRWVSTNGHTTKHSLWMLSESVTSLNESTLWGLELWRYLFFQKDIERTLKEKRKSKKNSNTLSRRAPLSHTRPQAFCSSCCFGVNWLCMSRTVWVGRVIKAALTKANLSRTMNVLTVLWLGHKGYKQKMAYVWSFRFRGRAWLCVTKRKDICPALSSPEEVTTRTWEVMAPSPPSLSARTSMV